MPRDIDDLMKAMFGSTDDMSDKDKEHADAIKHDLGLLMGGDMKEVRQNIIDDDYQKYVKKIEPYVHLWKLDDKAWVEERKTIWQKILESSKLQKGDDFVKKEWDTYGRFFLRAKPRKSDDDLAEYKRIALSPFDSPDQIREIYDGMGCGRQPDFHDRLLFYANGFYSATPEAFHYVELIAQALYNKDFVGKKEECGPRGLEYMVVCPRDFISRYAGQVEYYIRNSTKERLEHKRCRHLTGYERSYVEVTIDYFLDTLAYALSDEPEKDAGKINDYGIKCVKDMCVAIESYQPDVVDENREAFVVRSRERILTNDSVKQVLKIPDTY